MFVCKWHVLGAILQYKYRSVETFQSALQDNIKPVGQPGQLATGVPAYGQMHGKRAQNQNVIKKVTSLGTAI